MNKISNEQREAYVSKHIATPQGRNKLAETMTGPLRLRRDYASVARKAFKVDLLTRGTLPVYDKDADIAAYVIGEEGESIVSMAKSTRITFPLFELASAPSVPITQINERRYDIVERILEQAKVAIMASEDERVFGVMEAMAVNGFGSLRGAINPDLLCAGALNQNILADAWGAVEGHDLAVSRVFLNPQDAADFRKGGRDFYDPQTQQELLSLGFIGKLWGATLVSSRLVPRGQVFVCTEPEYFGRIPVRTELTILNNDVPGARTVGFSAFEQIGVGCFNPKGQCRILIRRDA